MLGSAFRGTLREAQAGDEQAFTRLWRDANPLMVRYLRVVGAEDPYDAACEGWITAVRGLTGYSGDEAGWRVWLLACARQRAEEDSERQRWATVTPIDRRAFSNANQASSAASAATAATAATLAMRGRHRPGFDVMVGDPVSDPESRGLHDTITALRALPLGQGEILVLRLGGGLPVQSVSDVVGSDDDTVRRSETRALERLGTDAELISWSLDAPPSTAELADERVALGAFRSIPRPPAWSVPRTRVVTVGDAPASRKDARSSRGIANAAGRSRTALLGIAMVSASVMSLGGLSAAAYVGALPEPVQKVMHETIGAPAPGATRGSHKGTPTSPTNSGRPGSGTAPVGRGGVKPVPTAQVTTPAKTHGKPAKTSDATTPSQTQPVPRGTGSPTRTPSSDSTRTHSPNSHSTKTPSSTAPPSGSTGTSTSTSTKTKGPNPNSTKTKGPSNGKGSSATTAPESASTTDVATPAG